jgi:hypothetical protein
MKCIWCKEEFKQQDEVITIEDRGIVHDSCATEYFWEHMTYGFSEFQDYDENDLKFYDDDGFYDDSFLLKPYDIFIDNEYFTTIIAKSEYLASTAIPIPMKKFEERLKNGESISMRVEECK